MGTQGQTGFERVVLGSVADKDAPDCSGPGRHGHSGWGIVEIGDQRYENILLPTDGSEGADLAIEWGITLAEIYDATVHTLYSVDTSRFGGVEGRRDSRCAEDRTGGLDEPRVEELR